MAAASGNCTLIYYPFTGVLDIEELEVESDASFSVKLFSLDTSCLSRDGDVISIFREIVEDAQYRFLNRNSVEEVFLQS